MAQAYLAGKRDGFSKPLGLFLFVALTSLVIFDISIKYRLEATLSKLQAAQPAAYQRWLNAPREAFKPNPAWPQFMNDRYKRFWDRHSAMPAPQAWLEGMHIHSRGGYFFILLYLPVIAVLLKAAFWRRRKYVGEHLVVTTYYFCAIFPLLLVTAFATTTKVPGAEYIVWSVIGLCWILLLDTINRVYGGRRWVNFLRGTAIIVCITYVFPLVARWVGPYYLMLKG
jgi:hypothetical protein